MSVLIQLGTGRPPSWYKCCAPLLSSPLNLASLTLSVSPLTINTPPSLPLPLHPNSTHRRPCPTWIPSNVHALPNPQTTKKLPTCLLNVPFSSRSTTTSRTISNVDLTGKRSFRCTRKCRGKNGIMHIHSPSGIIFFKLRGELLFLFFFFLCNYGPILLRVWYYVFKRKFFQFTIFKLKN